MTYPSSLSSLLFPTMCFKCVFTGVLWLSHTEGELLNSSLLHPSQFSLAPALNGRSLGLLELNHNYLPSSDWGWIGALCDTHLPAWHEKRSADSEGEHYVGLVDLTGEAEFETGVTVVLELLSLLFLSSLYLSIPLFLYISLFLSPSIPPASLSFFFSALSEHNCSYCAGASKKKSSVQG